MELDDPYDGAIPSGVSVCYNNILNFEKITGDISFKKMAEKIMNNYFHEIKRNPPSFSFMLNSYFLTNKKYIKITCRTKEREDKNMAEIIRELFRKKHEIIYSVSFDLNQKEPFQICDDTKCYFSNSFEELENSINAIK